MNNNESIYTLPLRDVAAWQIDGIPKGEGTTIVADLPALQRGTWVICDRFTDSTVAYQGFGRAHGDSTVRAKIAMLIEQFVEQLPDLTLWLDLPVLEGMARANKRSAADRFEQQATEFFTRVHQGFSILASEQPERIQRIDASGSAEEVSERIWQAVQEKFALS